MGERDVDEIIARWRDSARAAGEPDALDPEPVDEPAGRRLIRGRWPVLVLVLLGVAAVGVWLLGARAAEGLPESAEPPAPSATPTPAPESTPATGSPDLTLADDWYALVADVDQARADAYRTADPAGLAAVFAAGGEAHQHETALVADLTERGFTAQGWRTEILAVSPVRSTATQAQVRVIDSRSGYRLIGADGAATQVPAADPATWLIDFTKDADRWLVTRVSADPEAVTIPSGQP